MSASADSVRVYHVFISCPSDMEVERDAVRRFFDSFNRTIAKPFRLRFDVIDWENCTNAGFGEPQTLITSQTLSKHRRTLAMVIGIMGQRFGTPTGRFESGTQAEFEWAAKQKQRSGHPEIKWFFQNVQQFVAPAGSVRQLRAAVEQWKKVQRFRRSYQGLYKEFAGSDTFPEVLREDLLRWFSSWVERRRPARTRERSRPDARVPGFLDNRLSRTLRIVATLEDMVRDPFRYREPSLRICAVMSSLAVVDTVAWARPEDREYLELIVKERDLIERLLEKNISLKMLLTWNIHEILEWERRSREDVVARLRRLRSFCRRVVSDERLIKRAQLVHCGIRERNLLILGRKYVFEGRKLGPGAGFEATEVITEVTRVKQEIEMFDLLFRNAAREADRGASGVAQNRHLIERMIRRLNRDIGTLGKSRNSVRVNQGGRR
jgi:hypothetical protein